MAFSTFQVFSILFTLLNFLKLWFFILKTKDITSWYWCILGSLVLNNNCDDLFEISLFKQSSFKSLVELFSDLGVLRKLLSINSIRSKNSAFELSIKSSKVFLFLLKITTIFQFLFVSSTIYLTTCFLKIITIRFWGGKGVCAHVFPRQA